MTIELRPLTPAFGAEVSGVDLTRMSEKEFDEIFAAFSDYGVIFFRDQDMLTEDQHLAFGKRFGDIHIHPAARGKESDSSGFIPMRTHRESIVAAGNRWHSDVSCDERPPQASILQLHQTPTIGGDTLFSSLSAAYSALSDPLKVMLDGLTALHSGEEAYRHLFEFKNHQSDQSWPENSHPLIRKHVDSGRPVIFVDREFTKQINELPKEEGRALLNFLFEHTERVDFQCRFQWTQNAIAIWDNRCVLHHALWDYWPEERSGARVTVVGEKPVFWELKDKQVPEETGSAIRLTA
jgi:taurine dioxygenase